LSKSGIASLEVRKEGIPKLRIVIQVIILAKLIGGINWSMASRSVGRTGARWEVHGAITGTDRLLIGSTGWRIGRY